jgi:hypothetical protein
MILLDTETAMPSGWRPQRKGQSTDPLHARIWQIAVMDLETGAGHSWLVNPGFPLPVENRELSHIDDELHARIMAAPSITQVMPEVFGAIQPDGQVLAYNAGYDRRVLIEEARRRQIALPRGGRPMVWGDYLVRARMRFQAERHLRLGDLARLCGIPTPAAHTALGDLDVLRQVIDSDDPMHLESWWRPDEHLAYLQGDIPITDMWQTESLLYGGTLGAISADGIARIGRCVGGHPGDWVMNIAIQNGREWASNTGHPWHQDAWFARIDRRP